MLERGTSYNHKVIVCWNMTGATMVLSHVVYIGLAAIYGPVNTSICCKPTVQRDNFASGNFRKSMALVYFANINSANCILYF